MNLGFQVEMSDSRSECVNTGLVLIIPTKPKIILYIYKVLKNYLIFDIIHEEKLNSRENGIKKKIIYDEKIYEIIKNQSRSAIDARLNRRKKN